MRIRGCSAVQCQRPGAISSTGTAYVSAREHEPLRVLDRLLPRGWVEQQRDDRLHARVARRAQQPDRALHVVLGPAELDVPPEERPVRTRPILVREPDAPRLVSRTSPTTLSYWTWTCAVTTTRASIPVMKAPTRCRGVRSVTHSSSLRGEPWQKHVGPRPSTSTTTVGSKAARKARSSGVCRAAIHGPRPSCSTPTARSAFPRTNRAGCGAPGRAPASPAETSPR